MSRGSPVAGPNHQQHCNFPEIWIAGDGKSLVSVRKSFSDAIFIISIKNLLINREGRDLELLGAYTTFCYTRYICCSSLCFTLYYFRLWHGTITILFTIQLTLSLEFPVHHHALLLAHCYWIWYIYYSLLGCFYFIFAVLNDCNNCLWHVYTM